ncbi:hypothetical protein CW749_21685 [Vibrio sp. vnigr-6D03]|uniref:hypothetical protein n=1 Tax=Vibrio sp. vnigr-6D03 TaxID=2058088 RepID=UPI000C32A49C|nr:hypothetical protein [Vibrio sp. vnigr-6D03]PKF77472.1 hypothetical protein CW749_21685 [Vibrio sp. vnigr-6D03]
MKNINVKYLGACLAIMSGFASAANTSLSLGDVNSSDAALLNLLSSEYTVVEGLSAVDFNADNVLLMINGNHVDSSQAVSSPLIKMAKEKNLPIVIQNNVEELSLELTGIGSEGDVVVLFPIDGNFAKRMTLRNEESSNSLSFANTSNNIIQEQLSAFFKDQSSRGDK